MSHISKLINFLAIWSIIIEEINCEQINENLSVENQKDVEKMNQAESLCRGKFTISPEAQAKLHCYLKRDKPFLLLAPHKVEVVHLDPLVLIFRAVISDTEIFSIKTLASKKLCRAKVVDPNSGKTALANYRVSKSAWLKDGVHQVVERITKRVHDMTNLDTESAEDLQVASYGIGGHYAPHFDFFRSNEVDKRTFELYGNRIATVLFYLTQPHDGGFTIFTDLNIGIEPTEHDALFWYNLRSDGSVDPRTRHAACPVLSGNKWVANKWLHERGQEFIRPCPLKMAQQIDEN